MNYALILLIIFITNTYAKADCVVSAASADKAEESLHISTDVPAHLKGATIVVRLADGRESQVSAESYKVVPRQQQFIVTRVSNSETITCSSEQRVNRISLHAGAGSKAGLDVAKDSNEVIVKNRVGPVGAAQYQRLITNRLSLGVQLQSNESALIGIGLDF